MTTGLGEASNQLQDRCASASAKVKYFGARLTVFERFDVTTSQVNNVYIVAHTSAINRVVVVAKYTNFF